MPRIVVNDWLNVFFHYCDCKTSPNIGLWKYFSKRARPIAPPGMYSLPNTRRIRKILKGANLPCRLSLIP